MRLSRPEPSAMIRCSIWGSECLTAQRILARRPRSRKDQKPIADKNKQPRNRDPGPAQPADEGPEIEDPGLRRFPGTLATLSSFSISAAEA